MTSEMRNVLAAVVAEFLEPLIPALDVGGATIDPSDAAQHLDGSAYHYAEEWEALYEGGYIGIEWPTGTPVDERSFYGAFKCWPTAKGMYAVWGPR